MTATLLALALLALLLYGLEHNHRRQPYPRPPLDGSTDLPDRDAGRVRTELRAAADRAGPDWS